jgi:hypothetical protein
MLFITTVVRTSNPRQRNVFSKRERTKVMEVGVVPHYITTYEKH